MLVVNYFSVTVVNYYSIIHNQMPISILRITLDTTQ